MKNQNNHIDPNAKIGKSTKIEPFSFIDKDVKIGYEHAKFKIFLTSFLR